MENSRDLAHSLSLFSLPPTSVTKRLSVIGNVCLAAYIAAYMKITSEETISLIGTINRKACTDHESSPIFQRFLLVD